jgi:hypothetical protein
MCALHLPIIDGTDGRTARCVYRCLGTDAYEFKDEIFLSLTGPQRLNSYDFLGVLIVTATKISVTLNLFESGFTLSNLLVRFEVFTVVTVKNAVF